MENTIATPQDEPLEKEAIFVDSPDVETPDAKPAFEPELKIEVTLEQATRFYELMVEFGLDMIFDAVAKATTVEPQGVMVVTAAQQKEMASGSRELSQKERTDIVNRNLDLGLIFRVIAKNGGLIRLGAIMMGVTEEEAKNINSSELQRYMIPFLKESIGPLQMLLGYVGILV